MSASILRLGDPEKSTHVKVVRDAITVTSLPRQNNEQLTITDNRRRKGG